MWLLEDHTIRTVIYGSALVGGISGGLGCFAYLNRQSLVGDVIAHSSLLGIVLAFLVGGTLGLSGTRSLSLLMVGAVLAGLLASLVTRSVTTRTRLPKDAALGVMLAVFFGSGLTLLRWLQRRSPPLPGVAGLDDYLFGMAAATTTGDVQLTAMVGLPMVLLAVLAWNRLKIVTLDAGFATGLGVRVHVWEVAIQIVLVVSIVIGLQIVGVILMIALLITPAAAARQWTRHMGPMTLLAAAIGCVCAVTGAIVSSLGVHLPTGPVIVLLLAMVFLLSIFFAPQRGIVFRRTPHDV